MSPISSLFKSVILLFITTGSILRADTVTIINYADTWKYQVPTSDPGTNWRSLGFDDSTWTQGPGLLGFENSALPTPGLGTTIPKTGNNVTYLFRRNFNYNGSLTGATITISQVLDDGVVYYLNGQRLGSIGVNEAGAWNSIATRLVDNAVVEGNALSVPAPSLLNGNNVITADVRQYTPDSSDVVFGINATIQTSTPGAPKNIEHVILISVDGLRGDFLKTFIDQTAAQAPASQEFPNFLKFRNAAAFTYNARCDYTTADTSPNHVSMITGRWVSPRDASDTSHHGYSVNDWDGFSTITDFAGRTPADATFPPNTGVYKVSIFDVAHDNGLTTAFLTSKEKLLVINATYNEDNGAPDTTGVDNGKKKIDYLQYIMNFPPDPDYFDSTSLIHGSTTASNPNGIGAGVGLVSLINNNQLKNFTFLHLTEPDIAGHSSTTVGGGWKTAAGKYRDSVKAVDGFVGAILDAVNNSTMYKDKTVIMLTADHGGGYDGSDSAPTITSHRRVDRIENIRIPMFIKGPGFTPGSDLYAYFENRYEPGNARVSFAANLNQPIHNGDAGNIAATLLGLPEIPGSMMRPQLKKPVGTTATPGAITLTWPSYLTGYLLEKRDSLTSGSWGEVTTGITDSNGIRTYSLTIPPGSSPPNAGFFRLRKP